MMMNRSRVKRAFESVDRRVDRHFGFARGFIKKFFPIISTLFLALIVFVFVIRIFYSRPRIVASLIEDDVRMITLALERIDADCNILRVLEDRNEISFLNVKKSGFDGSVVGPLSLAYPEKWDGPYLNFNPTLQDRFYEIVKAKDGIFVVPGEGVALPNGMTVGKEFEVTIQTKVNDLLQVGGPLTFEDRAFGAQLMFKVGDWDPWLMRKETIRRLDRMIQEFHEAMPYTEENTRQKDRDQEYQV